MMDIRPMTPREWREFCDKYDHPPTVTPQHTHNPRSVPTNDRLAVGTSYSGKVPKHTTGVTDHLDWKQ